MSRAGELSFGELAAATPTPDTGPRSGGRRPRRGRWTVDDGRVRYRGQPSRGMPTREARDRMDLRLVLAEAAGAFEQLGQAELLTDRRERREANAVAIGRVALAQRALAEILERRRVTP